MYDDIQRAFKLAMQEHGVEGLRRTSMMGRWQQFQDGVVDESSQHADEQPLSMAA